MAWYHPFHTDNTLGAFGYRIPRLFTVSFEHGGRKINNNLSEPQVADDILVKLIHFVVDLFAIS